MKRQPVSKDTKEIAKKTGDDLHDNHIRRKFSEFLHVPMYPKKMELIEAYVKQKLLAKTPEDKYYVNLSYLYFANYKEYVRLKAEHQKELEYEVKEVAKKFNADENIPE